MYKMKVLGVIPARSGSKGVPRKNIRIVAGKPLIAWTIEQARRSKMLDKFIVSTDDKKIAAVAEKFGTEVSFLRPAKLAADSAKSVEVIIHALNWFKENGEFFDIVVLLQPTTPLRKPTDIDNAITMLLKNKKAKAIVSLCESERSPLWANTLPANGCMKNFLKQQSNKPRQELPVFYRINGVVFVAYSDYLRQKRSFYTRNTFAYIMPAERSVDIDSELDFQIAEALLRRRQRKEGNYV